MATPSPRESVRARINAAVAPCRNSSAKPFNATKLVIMALVLSNKGLTQKEVWLWINTTFTYYRTDVSHKESKRVRKLRRELPDVYRNYELPFSTTNAKIRDGGLERVDVRYTIAPWAAECFLQLPDDSASNTTTFPFFTLPRELRDVIYTIVFQYPRSGLYIEKLELPRGPEVLSRDLDHTEPYVCELHRLHRHREKEPLYTRHISSMLSPLLISRQFYIEAMPVFFDVNRFCFETLRHMSERVMSLPERCRRHIRSVAFECESHSLGGRDLDDTPYFRALAQLPNLRSLGLWLGDFYWCVDDWLDRSGVDSLLTIRGLDDVQIGGDLRLGALLEVEMRRPKPLYAGTR
ncbi:hypothetical protein LTR56_015720 [Elasticomyces elasticus]|nr:hypothetical protein LTR56_015720 [Elasticomyces elasticus]KAK3659249.1 hypothetical protein LTR22_008516 [Elasticomyces elasticus]KAK4914775.1 hypothetical protein LTR49_017010 [Elasticomyces elasticus]KAK5754245.1 hypothetical protein LTS12_015655 [Elasticomyces elasticus]